MRPRTLASLAVLGAASLALAGSLTPPSGPVAPTPGPEPRIPINATNTPGDADSSYKITQPGSYYLTGNVTGIAAKHGIKIESSNVTINLMGFALTGVAGSLDGIHSANNLFNLDVRNGSILSWGDQGVDIGVAGGSSRIDAIRSDSNGNDGISAGMASILTNCIAHDNGDEGISIGASSIISGCTSYANSGIGIHAGSGCTVVGCTAISNTGGGIDATSGTLVTNSSALGNEQYGIHAIVGSRVETCSAVNNIGDGIEAASNCAIIGNSCGSNGFSSADGAGILVTGSDNRIEGNQCTDSDRGIDINSSGNIIIRNTCAGNTTNWDIVIGNSVGAIVVAGTNAAAQIGSGPFASTLGSTDPNANYTY